MELLFTLPSPNSVIFLVSHSHKRRRIRDVSVYTKECKLFALFLDKAPLDYGQLEVCAI